MYRNRVVFPLLIPTGSRGRDEDLVNFTRRFYMLWDGLVLWQMRWIKSRTKSSEVQLFDFSINPSDGKPQFTNLYKDNQNLMMSTMSLEVEDHNLAPSKALLYHKCEKDFQWNSAPIMLNIYLLLGPIDHNFHHSPNSHRKYVTAEALFISMSFMSLSISPSHMLFWTVSAWPYAVSPCVSGMVPRFYFPSLWTLSVSGCPTSAKRFSGWTKRVTHLSSLLRLSDASSCPYRYSIVACEISW